MNPLTQIKNTQKATRAEIELGIGDKSSWHARFSHSAYVYAGGLPFELTEGDILAVFSQYGEIVDVHLVRDRKTGKSKGFAFIAYEDQRSTVVAVDNLSGARVAGRTIRVEHVDNYRKKRAEVEGEPIPESSDEEEERQRRGGAGDAIETHAAGRDGRNGGSGEAAAAGGGREPPGPGNNDHWGGGGNSFMDIMQQAKAQGLLQRPWDAAADGGAARAAGGRGGGGREEGEGHRHHKREKTEKKKKKEKEHGHKKEKKERRRERSRSRERDGHGSREERRRDDRERGDRSGRDERDRYYKRVNGDGGADYRRQRSGRRSASPEVGREGQRR